MAHQTRPVEPRSPWLAITFGCCASHRDSIEDEDVSALQVNGETEMRICYDQPQIVPRPRADPVTPRPTISRSMGRHVSQWVASSRDFATRASSRASVHTLSKPRRPQSRARPSIGRPMDFRHTDGLDGMDSIQSMIDDAPMPVRRRGSFRPLELSIYLPDGLLSPLPDFDEWDKLPPDLPRPAQALVKERDSRTNSTCSVPSTSSYLIQRKPVGSGSRRSSLQSQSELIPSRPLSGSLSFLMEEPTSRPDSLISNPNTLVRSHTQGTLSSPHRMVSRVASPARPRSNTEGSLSRGSLRRAKTDIDEAIRELNTIVEERRADAYRSSNQSPALVNRPPPSPSHHVPLIAPSLRMHVRSETLSDIGSAFSVPLASKPLPNPPSGSSSLSRVPTKLSLRPLTARSHSGPLDSNPITPPTPTMPSPATPIGRLGAWIKRSLPNTPTTPPLSFFKSNPSPKLPIGSSSSAAMAFYQCTPPLPPTSHPGSVHSRPSTSGSRTLAHNRQDSNETATVTLFSGSYPSTPALSSRCQTPEDRKTLDSAPGSPPTPATPARVSVLKGEGKSRRIPAPLNLEKEEHMAVERPLGSARSMASQRSLKPPQSPNYGLLKGMEIPVRAGGIGGDGMTGMEMTRYSGVFTPSPVTPVGVAF